MTPLILLLAVGQAGLLLWTAVHLSNLVMRPNKAGMFFWALVTLAGPVAIAKYAADQDRRSILCSAGDCLALVLSVACVRVIAVNKEEEQMASEYEENRRRRAAAAEAARKAQQDEEVRAAAAAFEVRFAAEEKKATEPVQAPRHLTPSLLRGGAPSPRLPTAPRK